MADHITLTKLEGWRSMLSQFLDRLEGTVTDQCRDITELKIQSAQILTNTEGMQEHLKTLNGRVGRLEIKTAELDKESMRLNTEFLAFDEKTQTWREKTDEQGNSVLAQLQAIGEIHTREAERIAIHKTRLTHIAVIVVPVAMTIVTVVFQLWMAERTVRAQTQPQAQVQTQTQTHTGK